VQSKSDYHYPLFTQRRLSAQFAHAGMALTTDAVIKPMW
jgi:hypothetical protein